MKKFYFQLETLYTLRMRTEEVWRMKLAEANRLCASIQENINRHESDLRRTRDRVQDIHLLHARELYLNRLRSEIQDLSEEYRIADGKREEVRGSYIRAQRDYKIMETLRNKRISEYKKQIAREEILEVDDIISSRGGFYGA